MDHDVHRLIHCVSGCGSAHKDGHTHLHSRGQLVCLTHMLMMQKVQAWVDIVLWLNHC